MNFGHISNVVAVGSIFMTSITGYAVSPSLTLTWSSRDCTESEGGPYRCIVITPKLKSSDGAEFFPEHLIRCKGDGNYNELCTTPLRIIRQLSGNALVRASGDALDSGYYFGLYEEGGGWADPEHYYYKVNFGLTMTGIGDSQFTEAKQVQVSEKASTLAWIEKGLDAFNSLNLYFTRKRPVSTKIISIQE